jgi:type IV secretion system protein VirB8
MGLFSSSQGNQQEHNKMTPQSSTSGNSANAKNWYVDRYESVVVQRNLLFVFSVFGLAVVFISVFFVATMAGRKTIEPMVIEIEEMTGITNIVNPQENRRWTESKAVNEYFLIQYLRARETYNVATYLHNYNDLVRMLSYSTVYKQFKKTLNDPSTSPVAKYGANNSTTLKIRSMQISDGSGGNKNAVVRFVITETQGARRSYNKIVSIVWNYSKMNLTFEQRMLNPLGFQIKSYSVTEDRNV